MKKIPTTRRLVIQLISFIGILLLVSCMKGQQVTPVLTTIQETDRLPTQSPFSPADDQKKRTQTISEFATLTPISTEKVLSIETPEKRITTVATSTPIPAVPSEEKMRLVSELLENNGNCDMPCWWGIVPDETTWEAAYEFLASFASIEKSRSYSLPIEEQTHFVEEFRIKFWATPEKQLEFGITVLDGVVVKIGAAPKVTRESFQLHQLLEQMGVPGQVWIKTYPSAPGPIPFLIAVYYPDVKVIAFYETDAIHKDNVAMGCFGEVGPFLYIGEKLDAPEGEWTEEEVENWILGPPPHRGHIQTLEQATPMGLQEFYNLVLSEGVDACVPTPLENWGWD